MPWLLSAFLKSCLNRRIKYCFDFSIAWTEFDFSRFLLLWMFSSLAECLLTASSYSLFWDLVVYCYRARNIASLRTIIKSDSCRLLNWLILDSFSERVANLRSSAGLDNIKVFDWLCGLEITFAKWGFRVLEQSFWRWNIHKLASVIDKLAVEFFEFFDSLTYAACYQ